MKNKILKRNHEVISKVKRLIRNFGIKEIQEPYKYYRKIFIRKQFRLQTR